METDQELEQRLRRNRENPECPYCGQSNFENETEEGIHRANCDEAAYEENGSIPKKGTSDGKKENKVDDYKKQNYLKQNGENP